MVIKRDIYGFMALFPVSSFSLWLPYPHSHNAIMSRGGSIKIGENRDNEKRQKKRSNIDNEVY